MTWDEIEAANEEGRSNVDDAERLAGLRITQNEMDEAADALDTLAGIDEGENMDTERLHELALRLRKGDSDAVPVWLRKMLGPKTDEERRQRRLDLIAEVIRLREQRQELSEQLQLVTEAGQHHVIATEAVRQALGSVIDVLDELCMGLAVGQTPDRPWGETVSQTLSEHRRKLGFNEPGFGG
jgi:hypothetical protein